MSEKKSSRKLCALLIAVAAVLILNSRVGPYAAAADKYKSLYRFKGGKDGSLVYGSLVFDPAGNLYGTTYVGGADNYGTVFELSPHGNGGWTKSVLHSFNGNDGGSPWDGVIFDAAGNLYGTTYVGGADNFGTVFELSPNTDGSWTEKVLHSFNGNDGRAPWDGVILDAAGNVYGTTYWGGTDNYGTVFELSPNANGRWTEKVLHSFKNDRKDGALPYAELVLDQTGNLYGTTSAGGTKEDGIVFQLSPNRDGSWTEKVLHSFSGADGKLPFGGLIFDEVGNLYGTTLGGGAGNDGTAFELSPKRDGTWTEKLLHSFNGKDGAYPRARLIFDTAGNLYGTAGIGGRYFVGTVFRLRPANGRWDLTVVHTFKDHPGAVPDAPLIFDANGNLYGTTAGNTQ